jgi:hypothetical protein
VPEREPVRPERTLHLRPAGPGAEGGEPVHLVDVEERTEAGGVEDDDGPVAVRRKGANDAGSATAGDDGQPVACRDGEDLPDGIGVVHACDDVRDATEPAGA